MFQDPAQSELFQAVMALDAKYRLTIYLYYYEGCSVSETAAALRAKPSHRSDLAAAGPGPPAPHTF